MVGVGGREGDWWLPAGSIRASQGIFSSDLYDFAKLHSLILHAKFQNHMPSNSGENNF